MVTYLRGHPKWGEMHHVSKSYVTHITYDVGHEHCGVVWIQPKPDDIFEGPPVQHVIFEKHHGCHGQLRVYIGEGSPFERGRDDEPRLVQIGWQEGFEDHGKVLNFTDGMPTHYTFEKHDSRHGTIVTFDTFSEQMDEMLRVGLGPKKFMDASSKETMRDVATAAEDLNTQLNRVVDDRTKSQESWLRCMQAYMSHLSEEQMARKVLATVVEGMQCGFSLAYTFAGEHVLQRKLAPVSDYDAEDVDSAWQWSPPTTFGSRICACMNAKLDDTMHPSVAAPLPAHSPDHVTSIVEARLFNEIVEQWTAQAMELQAKHRRANQRLEQMSIKLNDAAKKQHETKLELLRREKERDELLREKNEKEAAKERQRMEERRAAREQAEKDEQARRKQENAEANARSRLKRAEERLEKLVKQIETTKLNTEAGKARTMGNKGKRRAHTPAALARSAEEQRQHDEWVDPKEKKAREDLFNAKQAVLAAEAETRKLKDRQEAAKAERLRCEQHVVEAAHRPPATSITVGEALAEGVARASLLGRAVNEGR